MKTLTRDCGPATSAHRAEDRLPRRSGHDEARRSRGTRWFGLSPNSHKVAISLFGLVVGLFGVSDSRAELAPAWELGATFFPDQALAAFDAAGGNHAEGGREARFGRAAMLLTATPTTHARRDAAIGLLEALSAEPDPQDDLDLAARYLLGRIAQVFLEPADPVAAAAYYEALIEHHPDSRWARLALTRHALLLLFTAAGPTAPTERIARVQRLLELASDDATRRNLHLALARAYFVLPALDPVAAVPHLQATVELGGLDYATRGDALVQLIVLLNLDGQRAAAAPYIELFVQEHQRDKRRYLLEQELQSLRAEPAGPTQLFLPPRS